MSASVIQAIIHLVRTQYFQKKKHFLPPYTDILVSVHGVRNIVFFFGKFCGHTTKWMIAKRTHVNATMETRAAQQSDII